MEKTIDLEKGELIEKVLSLEVRGTLEIIPIKRIKPGSTSKNKEVFIQLEENVKEVNNAFISLFNTLIELKRVEFSGNFTSEDDELFNENYSTWLYTLDETCNDLKILFHPSKLKSLRMVREY